METSFIALKRFCQQNSLAALAIFLLLLVITSGYSQTITGPTQAATQGTVYQVQWTGGYPQWGGLPFDPENELDYFNWMIKDLSGDYIYDIPVSQDSHYETTVIWQYEGSFILEFELGTRWFSYATNTWQEGYYYHSLEVTVVNCSAPDPIVSFSVGSDLCAPRVVTYSGTPPNGIVWYWQTSPFGTDKSNFTNTKTVSSPANLYVRAFDPATNCWSNYSPPVNVYTVHPMPETPSPPTVSTNTCGPKTLTRGTGSNASWFWQGADPNGTNTEDNNLTFLATTTGTYYLRARNSTGCWSANSASVNVTVEQGASFTVFAGGPGTICAGTTWSAEAELSISDVDATYFTWYRNNNIVYEGMGWDFAVFNSNNIINGDKIKCKADYNGATCVANTTAWSEELTASIISQVNPFIVIDTETGNTSFCAGDNITFEAYGNTVLTNIRWTLDDGSPVTTTTPVFTTNQFTSTSTLTVTATATGACLNYTTVSDNVSDLGITVLPRVTPSVHISASNITICAQESGDITFTATPTNGGSPTYQWMINGSVIATSSTNTWTRPKSSFANGDRVQAIMTTSLACFTQPTAISNEITMSVFEPIHLEVNVPNPGPICAQTTQTFEAGVSLSDDDACLYTWYINGVVEREGLGYQFAQISPLPLSNGDSIRCKVTYTGSNCVSGSPASSERVVMTVIPLSNPSVVIDIPSGNTIYCEGDPITFEAQGNNLSNVQWRINNSPVGTNSAFLTTNEFTSTSTLTVTGNVTGTCLTGTTATTTVDASDLGISFRSLPDPVISPSGTVKIRSTESQVITATPSGSDYTYQWKQGESNIPSATQSSYTASEAGIYTVAITPVGCTAGSARTSGTLDLQKNALPVANAGSHQAVVLPASSVTLTGTASDSDNDNLSYLWTKESGPFVTLSGITTPTLTVSNLKEGDFVFRFTVNDGLESSSSIVTMNIQYPPNNYNYVRETTVLVKDKKNIADVTSLAIGGKVVTTSYYDGLGRPMQSVAMQGSPSGKDLVQPVVYDNYNREARKYLPFTAESDGYYKPGIIDAAGNYTGVAASFYSNNPNGKIAQDARPFSETIFEPSPLNRPLKDFGPGEDWHDNNKFVEHGYTTNIDGSATGTEKIIAWTVNASGMPERDATVTGTTSGAGYYPTSALFVKRTIDEAGHEVREYTDKQGRVVLKKVYVSGSMTDVDNHNNWTQTYYVYDDFGNLRFVLQPQLVKDKIAGSATYNPDATDLAHFAFQYKYDARQRMIEKQVPGADAVYMVYDKRDRLVLTQDGNQRTKVPREWTFTKHDALNRPVLSGIYKDALNRERDVMQQDVNTFYNGGAPEAFYEEAGSAVHGYTNRSFPEVSAESDYFTVTFYDNYNFKALLNNPLYDYRTGELVNQPSQPNTLVKGLVTATKIKVLEENTWLWNITYYDEKYRGIQTVSDNSKGGIDRVTHELDFPGKVLASRTSHSSYTPSWTQAVGVKIENNKITKTAVTNWGNGGATSKEVIMPGASGWIEATVAELTTNRGFGFSHTNFDPNYTSMIYGVYINLAQLRIWDNGTATILPDPLMPNDVLRVEKNGTSFKVLKNGQEVHASLNSHNYEVRAAVSFYQQHASISVRASFAEKTTTIEKEMEYDHAGRLLRTYHNVDPFTQDVRWTGLVNATNTGNALVLRPVGDNSLYKNVNTGDWDAGASSSQVIPAGVEGWIEATHGWVQGERAFGLSEQDDDSHLNSIDYALYLGTDVRVYERGQLIASFGNYAPGDVFRIERTGNTIYYKRNGSTIHESARPSYTKLRADVSIKTGAPHGFIENVKIHIGSPGTQKVLLAENEYNELGQLIDKRLHSEDDESIFKQHIDYRYNIRGWLTRINNADLTPDGNEPRDYFGMELAYNNDIGIGTTTPQYNGNISAIKWSTNLGLGIPQLDQPVEKAYTFSYDPLNRLTGAMHREKLMTWSASNSFHENNLTYDLNGNIESLSRKGAGGANLDILTYDYGTGAARSNRLLKVTDAGDPTKGFVDGLNSGNDYDYDNNGNMIHDLNKKIGISLADNTSKITYNYLNLPEKIQKDNGEKMVNIYDATGRKLSQVIYDTAGVVAKRVDYIGEFFYQNDTLQFISHEEGRVVPQDGSMAYEYHLKDHLGNVRLTFTTQPKTDTYTAGFEDANITNEQAEFNPSYDDAVKVSAPLYNHTPGGNTSQRLSAASENEIAGLARSLDVVPGDTVHMEVYAKYTAPGTDATNIANNILAAISGAFGLSPSSTGIGELAYQSLTAMNTLGLLIHTGPGVDPTKPKAYLNYILFDEDFVAYDFGFSQVTGGLENGSGVPHQKLELTAVARKPGYVYIYLSNENGVKVDVFFDDFTIAHKHSPVLEESSYYPFGMVAENYQKKEMTWQPFKYNGKEEIGFTSWLDYGSRMYMPEIGRWSTIDPFAGLMRKWSPYNYTFDNPVRFIDPDGSIPWPVNEKFKNFTRRVASWFGPRNVKDNPKATKNHKGLDINFGSGYDDYGAPVLTTHDGKVTVVKDDTKGNGGRTVIVESPDGKFRTSYFHLSQLDVKVGQKVTEGQTIGKIGASAFGSEDGTASHLHYAIEVLDETGEFEWYNPTEGKGNEDKNIVDPQKWIAPQMGSPENSNVTFTNSSPAWARSSKIAAQIYFFFTGVDPSQPDQLQGRSKRKPDADREASKRSGGG